MANFLEHKAVNYLFPEMESVHLISHVSTYLKICLKKRTITKKDVQFLIDNKIPVMYDDGFESSHPVIYDIKNPDEIGQIFDSITYDKGSSLLFMLENTVGDHNFRDGLRVLYFNYKYKYID
jgi:aminopeptidase N